MVYKAKLTGIDCTVGYGWSLKIVTDRIGFDKIDLARPLDEVLRRRQLIQTSFSCHVMSE